MPHLTPRAERALCACLESALCHTQAQHLGPPTYDPYAPLDFNRHSVPDLPDWQEYYHDDIDSYV